ncbi:MAG: hypothetical protein QOI59_1817, partial [Gammaproteobacteria bacterium]|nr:hypothetical protein [Gammaproteobacteria bacterium]
KYLPPNCLHPLKAAERSGALLGQNAPSDPWRAFMNVRNPAASAAQLQTAPTRLRSAGGPLPGFGISGNDLLSKYAVQDRWITVRIEGTPEIESVRVRAIGV